MTVGQHETEDGALTDAFLPGATRSATTFASTDERTRYTHSDHELTVVPEHLRVANFFDNDAFVDVFQLLTNTIFSNPLATRAELSALVHATFPNGPTDEFVVGFDEARALDHHFFNTGNTNYWLAAYDYPQNLECAGIFTFKLAEDPDQLPRRCDRDDPPERDPHVVPEPDRNRTPAGRRP
jgi:hypothetical protein